MAGHATFEEPAAAASRTGAESVAQRVLGRINHAVFTVSAVAMLLAAAIMTYGVVVRHAAGIALNWQDEVCVFLLVGATFLSAATVQARRGHVGIEAVAALLSPGANRIRLLFADVLSFAFVALFTWKSWTLWHEAWDEGQISHSAWGPPLWIPYLLMCLGMTLLSLQILVQIVDALTRKADRP